MIMCEGLAIIGFIFYITIPVLFVRHIVKSIHQYFKNHSFDHLLYYVHEKQVITEEDNLLWDKKIDEIHILQKAIDNTSNPIMKQKLRDRIYALIYSSIY